MKIKLIRSRWVLDSRGVPTVEVDVLLANGAMGRASVPSGASVGKAEATELRDSRSHFFSKGVSKALNNIEHVIAPVLIGKNADNQESIDALLCAIDGTADKKRLGANAILAVSTAVAKAAAQAHGIPLYRYVAHLSDSKPCLPVPMFNILNGGAHATGVIDCQEIMIIPVGAKDIYTAVRMGAEIYHELGNILMGKRLNNTVGDEGGFAPFGVEHLTYALDLVMRAVERAGYKAGKDIKIGLDVAASQLYRHGRYMLHNEHHELGARGMTLWYDELLKRYPIVSIEDPFDEDSWGDWRSFGATHQKLQIVADDLVTTNEKRLAKAIKCAAANTLLVKPNQVGTVTQTIHAAKAAQAAGWRVIVSHRSGETEDTAIAHIAVGLGCGQFKSGAPARGERTAKYNELLRISESLKSDALATVWL